MIIEYFLVVLISLCFGSFANVCIYRLPLNKTILTFSFCPHCSNKIPFYNNIPIFSYLFLRGKASCCQKKISAQYPFVETIVGAIGLFVFMYSGYSLNTILLFIFFVSLVILFFTDFQNYIIPNNISYPIAFVGLLISLLNINPFGIDIVASLLGGTIGGLILFFTSKIYLFIRKKEGMGMGDVKIITMIGCWLGIESIVIIIIISSLLGSLVGIGLVLMKRIEPQQYIPYGCFISVSAGLICFLDLFYQIHIFDLLLF